MWLTVYFLVWPAISLVVLMVLLVASGAMCEPPASAVRQ